MLGLPDFQSAALMGSTKKRRALRDIQINIVKVVEYWFVHNFSRKYKTITVRVLPNILFIYHAPCQRVWSNY